jgi:SPP1 gp7 family putative phage head morphogenesis protein
MASKYWEHRAALRQAAYDRANNQTVATVTKAYDRAMNQLDIDIDKIMATYTRKTGLTARDAYAFLRDGVPPGVMDDLRARAAAITDKTQAKQLGVMLRTDAYRARISRLDAIKASTRVGLSEAAEAELRAITPHLRHTADLAYSRTMFDIQKVTAGFEMVGVPRKALDTILKSKWSGMNYAQSVWANRDAMAGVLDRALMEQASMGKLSQITFDNVRGIVDSKAWADKVAAGMKSKFKSEMQYSKYAANRLIRTESAYVAGQTTAVAYDECEIERYEFMATLDNRTSSKCAGKDGEIYVTKDKEVGVNWPPLHPHCRSTTAPVIDGLVRENLTRAARDKDGKSVYVPRDMDFSLWAKWQKDGAPADVQAWLDKRQ